MANSPRYKIYANNKYQASCHEVEAAAALVAFYGNGSEIRAEHSSAWTLWKEGQESQSAAESYDFVAQICIERLRCKQIRAYEKATGKTFQEVQK
jgi:hypothetical protein